MGAVELSGIHAGVGGSQDLRGRASGHAVPDAATRRGDGPAIRLVGLVREVVELGLSGDDLIKLVSRAAGLEVCEEDEKSEDTAGCSTLSVPSSRSSERRRARAKAKVQVEEAFARRTLNHGAEYLWFIKPAFAGVVWDELGPSPSLLRLLGRSAREFRPVVLSGGGPTLARLQSRQLLVDPGRTEGYSLVQCAKTVASVSAALVHVTWLQVPALAHAELADVVCVDTVQGAGLSVTAARAAVAEGYCHLSLFPESLRVLRCVEFQAWPTLGSLTWAKGTNPDARLSYVGSSRWHVCDDGDVTWREVCDVLRRGEGKGLVCKGFGVRELRTHVVGGSSDTRSSQEGKDGKPDNDSQAVEEHGRAMLARLRSNPSAKVEMAYIEPDWETEGVQQVSRSSVVFPNPSGLLSIEVPKCGLVVIPGGSVLRVGEVSSESSEDRFAVLTGIACFSIEKEGKWLSCFVKPLSTSSWRRFTGYGCTLPYASSTLRLSQMLKARLVYLSRTSYLDGKDAGKVLNDETDPWLAVTHRAYTVNSAVTIHTHSCNGVVVYVTDGSMTVNGRVHLGAGSKVAVTGGQYYTDHLPGLRVEPDDRGAKFEVYGVADPYSFDGGGPSGDESCCSGEEFSMHF